MLPQSNDVQVCACERKVEGPVMDEEGRESQVNASQMNFE